MKVGTMTPERLREVYQPIDSHPVGYRMYESEIAGEKCILVVYEPDGSYCWTDETLEYTIEHKDEFTWHLLREEAKNDNL